MLTIFHGRPQDISGRHPREVRVYDFLDHLGVSYDRLDHEPAMTMEVCAQIDAAFERTTLQSVQEVSAEERAQHPIICKNLVLCNRQKTKFYLLMMPGDKKFLIKDLSTQINSARLSFASEEDMLRLLDVTPGSASVLALMNDGVGQVQLLIDRDVLQSQWVGCHPCMNTSSLRLRTDDLTEKILPALAHEPIVVRL